MQYQKMVRMLATMPDQIFWVDYEGGKPDYKGLMIQILSKCADTSLVVELKPEDIPNPSSFQRAVAREAKSRRDQAA